MDKAFLLIRFTALAMLVGTAHSETLYEALGPEESGALFKSGDGTHHNNCGAYELANCIVAGIRANKLPLAKLLADDVPVFDPASPQITTVTPLGN